MDRISLINSLQRNGKLIVTLAGGLDKADAARRPAPEKWSSLEIMCHLLDEEREDFRVRLKSTLADPAVPWPGIDPAGWVTERRYREQDLAETVAAFTSEREQSLVWLRTLDNEPWGNRYEHPLLGGITAGDLLASWAAHDLLHLRQLLHVAWLEQAAAAAPFGTAYAGDW